MIDRSSAFAMAQLSESKSLSDNGFRELTPFAMACNCAIAPIA